jgi:hypothetical protein
VVLKKILLGGLLAAAIIVSAGSPRAQTAHAAGGAMDEYLVKGAFVLNFAKFVEWPSFCFSATEKHFTVGILGMNPFADILSNLARDKEIQGRRIRVQTYKTIEEVEDCQMLFIGVSESRRLKETLEALKGRGVLTISDIRGFVDGGGMIGLVVVDNRVQFEINEMTSRREKVKFSAQLLKLAKRVIPAKR